MCVCVYAVYVFACGVYLAGKMLGFLYSWAISYSVTTVQYSLLMENHQFDKAPAKFWNTFYLLVVLLECLVHLLHYRAQVIPGEC